MPSGDDFSHTHTHTEYSPLDGMSLCREAARRAAADGNPIAFITDHGNCAGHPDWQRACDAEGLIAGFGMEGYFVPERLERPASGDEAAQKRLRANNHLILLAMSDKGLRNLWALSTEAYSTGFYHKPRCDWELLAKYGEDLIITTSCLGGSIPVQLMAGDYGSAAADLHRLSTLFPGRLYLEVQANAIPEQRKLNRLLAEVSAQTGIPLVAASDSHFPSPDMSRLHRTLMACKTGQGNDDYWHISHMQTRDEVLAGLTATIGPEDALKAVRNAGLIGQMCRARIGGEVTPPVFGASADEDSRVLGERTYSLLMERISRGGLRGGSAADYLARHSEEFKLVAGKGLAGCYLMVEDFISAARAEGILVGPGRGSAAGSLMSWLLRITVSDPLETGLMFSRFLTEGRTALPDFDLDFPSSARPWVLARATAKYGEPNVVRVGTHMRWGAKSILDKLFSIAKDILPPEAPEDNRYICSVIDEAESHTAGLGLPWDELMTECADQLEPYVLRYEEVFSTARQLVGRLRSYGRHPAGLVISPGVPLEGLLPMRIASPDDRSLVSQWDFRDAEATGRVKIDFLTLRTLNTAQETIRLIRKRTGIIVDPWQWDEEYRDPQVWEDVGTGRVLGVFQVEKRLGREWCEKMKPQSVAELAALIALIRPGPRNSGMAETYLRRRAGEETVTFPHPALEPYLDKRFGVLVFQEDILMACIVLAGYDGAQADGVRKVLGKKLLDKIDAAGTMFADHCEKHGVATREEAEALWEAMAEFGRYGFNLAHATSYAVLAYWTAWLKSHYPAEYLAAVCSTLTDKDKDRIPVYVTEARRLGIGVRPPDVNRHVSGFDVEWPAMRYGLDSIKGVGAAAIGGLERGRPFSTLAEASAAVNKGVLYSLALAGALDSVVPSRRSAAEYIESDKAGDLTRCVHKDDSARGPNNLPCVFDWSSELPIERISGKTGKVLKPRVLSPPARCTKGCRQYLKPQEPGMDPDRRYPPDVLWRLEWEIFGTWLSPDAFEAMEKRLPGSRDLSAVMTDMWDRLPVGAYQVPGILAAVRMARTKTGSQMAWLILASELGFIEMAVFRPRFADDGPDLVSALRTARAGIPVAALAERQRYQSPDGWRTSARLRDLRSL